MIQAGVSGGKGILSPGGENTERAGEDMEKLSKFLLPKEGLKAFKKEGDGERDFVLLLQDDKFI